MMHPVEPDSFLSYEYDSTRYVVHLYTNYGRYIGQIDRYLWDTTGERAELAGQMYWAATRHIWSNSGRDLYD